MYVEYNPYNTRNLMQAMANSCGVRIKGNSFSIPSQFGEGEVRTFNFNSGISALISEMRMTEEVIVTRHQHANLQNFILLFHEQLEKTDKKEPQKNSSEPAALRNQVRLSSSLITTEDEIVPFNKIRSVVVIFNKSVLLNFLDYEVVEKFTNIYFSFYLKKNYVSPVDADYRVILQELHREVDTHPLVNIFTENRILLLLEKFLSDFLVQDKHSGKWLQFKEEEIAQLVKAETTLLEDFSKTPPTINQLSRLCTMSPTKFKNDFKALYGLPVYEYYQQHRMAYARSLIQEGEYAIKEVGIMVGYSNLGHFAAAFKKEFAMLPSEWMHANRIHPDVTNNRDEPPSLAL
ncbi:MAG: AraC family transcriptional regulator [Parafilimonas sp.]